MSQFKLIRCSSNTSSPVTMLLKAVACVLLAYLVYQLFCPTRPAPIVSTKYGQVQGIISKSRGGRDFYSYLGIPFARPPVGELRYESPEPPAPWSGVRDASFYGNRCIQNPLYFDPLTGDEDCLFVNVFRPISSTKAGSSLPVMAWIHGGHFVEGYPEMYQPQYFMDEDVVIVTIQYRLNSFGFLDTGDGVVRGNMGLKDQALALKWIQENIDAFGGDPSKVTIFGESAGGTAVHMHLLSPMSKGLFHKAISQSGAATGSWAMQRKPAIRARRLGEQLNCPTENTLEMVNCLKKIPALDIVKIHDDMKNPLKDQMAMYLPTVEAVDDEHAFLAKHPQKIMDNGKDGLGIPWLTGVNSEDGSVLWTVVHRVPQAKARMCDSEYWNYKIADLLYLDVNASNSKNIVNSIRSHYFNRDGDVCDVDKYRKQYNDMFCYPTFFNPFYNAARLHAKHSPTYAYYFSHIGDASINDYFLGLLGKYPLEIEFMALTFKQWVAKLLGYTPNYTGSAHGDDLRYLFHTGMTLAKEQEAFSRQLVKTWVQFATDEKSASFMNVKMEPLNPKDKGLKCLEINTKPKYISFPHENDVQFWNSLKM